MNAARAQSGSPDGSAPGATKLPRIKRPVFVDEELWGLFKKTLPAANIKVNLSGASARLNNAMADICQAGYAYEQEEPPARRRVRFKRIAAKIADVMTDLGYDYPPAPGKNLDEYRSINQTSALLCENAEIIPEFSSGPIGVFSLPIFLAVSGASARRLGQSKLDLGWISKVRTAEAHFLQLIVEIYVEVMGEYPPLFEKGGYDNNSIAVKFCKALMTHALSRLADSDFVDNSPNVTVKFFKAKADIPKKLWRATNGAKADKALRSKH